MTMTFSAADATVVSIIVESIIYGFSIFMFGVTVWILVYSRPTERVNYLMCVAVSLLFILGTMHIAVDAQSAYSSLVPPGDSPLHGSEKSTPTLKNVIHECEILLADAVLIYRCYATWRNIWVIFPSIVGWFSVFVTGTLSVWTMSLPENGNFFDHANTKWYISYTALAVATNLMSTCLLAYKLWAIDRAMSQHRKTRSVLRPVMRIILECGAVYSIALLISIVTYRVRSNGTYVMMDIIGQIIPITFYVIILCASMSQFMLSPTQLSAPQNRESVQILPTSMALGESRMLITRTPVEVHISHCVDHDGTASLASANGSEKAV